MSNKTKNINILIVDPVHQKAVDMLENSGFSVTTKLFPKSSDLVNLLDGFDVLICRTHTKLNKKFFESVSDLKYVALASTGYDQIDLASATENDISIIGLPSDNKNIDTKKHGNFISTAEHTMLLILASLGNFFEASCSMKAGRWEKSNFVGEEAHNKKLGFVGFGRISKLVASRARAFGMETIAYDPYVSMEEMSEHVTEKVDLESLCKESDIITIHAPKTKETEDLIDEDKFSIMKDGVIIVNAARSEIINKDSLIEALDSGKVSRAALDVFLNEPNDIEWDLVKHNRVVPTPHIGGSTNQALERISVSTAESLINLLVKGDRSNVINK